MEQPAESSTISEESMTKWLSSILVELELDVLGQIWSQIHSIIVNGHLRTDLVAKLLFKLSSGLSTCTHASFHQFIAATCQGSEHQHFPMHTELLPSFELVFPSP